ncbi:DUF3363 domain-containing protein [Variovorax paradoxus]|uniref:DUF3363 domain-containing protein n=1 Tax=Variovorax paradoxus TaxID=34073 RepID=UPI0029C982DF|nr:DUF3363 domain-containing protein [Variovorax paradoxus]
MPGGDDDRFRVKPAVPRSRDGPRSPRFILQVLKQVSKAGAKRSGKNAGRPANTFGRGRVAVTIAGQRLGASARRVIIKTRFVVLQGASSNSVSVHLRYIERDGVTRGGQRGLAYGQGTDVADLAAFQERGHGDRHQFRFIVSPEDGLELEDLKGFTRQLMRRMEVDLETRLDWVAVDHWDTDNPHIHIVLNGRTASKKDLVISPDYMAHGMRMRASEIATEWLGPRTEAEIRQSLIREVDQQRLTSLDRALIRQASRDGIDLTGNSPNREHQNVLGARLQRLEGMGLAERVDANRWKLEPGMEKMLAAMGEREDALVTMRRALKDQQRELVVFQPGDDGRAIVGRVIGKGIADELSDKGYLVIDGIDGKAHYVALPARSELGQYPTGAVVEVKGSADVHPADRAISTLAVNGVYRTDHHLAVAQRQVTSDCDPRDLVAAHVRRLEALRRAGIVERAAEGIWHVPHDLGERGRQYDARRLGGSVAVELKSNLPIERQARVIGATWLDRQLIGGGKGLGDSGFGSEVKEALQKRADFLAEHELAERRGQRVILARNLLATLRNREVAQAAKDIAAETGLEPRPVVDGQRVAGIYRRSIILASGRYAMLDDGMGFNLVPWKPVIERRLGQQIAVTVRGRAVSWEVGRQRGVSVG